MKLVFSFGEGKAEGDPTRRDLLGGKGAGRAEMTSLGLPVPPGFTISTDAHHPRQLAQMRYGVLTARRAWLGPEDILNTLPLEGFEAALRARTP